MTKMDISIIIPTYKRPALLKKCLESIFRQDYPKEEYEVIVVMDGKDQVTEEMLQGLVADSNNLRYFTQKEKGPAAARNSGAGACSGELIGFVDDDCCVGKGWIRSMVKRHGENPGIAAVGGFTVTPNNYSTVLVSQFLANCSIETQIDGKREVIFFPTCNVSFKRWVFERYSFDEQFPFPGGEDLEFFWRIFKDGFKFIWDTDIKVIHNRDRHFINFIRQAYIYGRGNALAQYLHSDQPLLKELKMGRLIFWFATAENILKIPRFSYLLGRRLIIEKNVRSASKKFSLYAYFVLHKVFYILGNILEYFRILGGDVKPLPGLLRLPRLLILDITHSCNLQCRICDIWKTGEKEEDIGIAYIKNTLRDARKLGIPEITLSGGEPLRRKDIFEIMDYARRIRIKNMGVLSNGILIGPLLDRLRPFLLDNTISLVISLDSLKPSLHNEIRNAPFAWEKTMESLNLLADLKKKYPQVNFNVITIILDQNLEELEELAVFIRSLGTNSLQFQALLPNNLRMAERKDSYFWVSRERLPLLDSTIDRLAAFSKENPDFIKNSAFNIELIKQYYRGALTSREVSCLSAQKTVLISNRGEYATCFSCYGDIRSETLKDVLQGKEIIKARRLAAGCNWPCLLPCFCDS